MKKILEGKNVIITGTAGGIGSEMVRYFAEQGANVFAHARKETDIHSGLCKEISEQNSVEVYPLYFDLTDSDGIKKGIKEIREKKVSIDGLVNNAGIGSNSLFQMTSMDELRNVFESDFFGPYLLTQYISKIMTRQGYGSIVTISSTSALDGNSGKSVYGAAKAALITMTKSIAEELGRNGVRANSICPGVIMTEAAKMMPGYIFEIEQNATFLGKLGETSDVAKVAAFLVSDMSEYVTGQVIRVDGGKRVYQKEK